jgi:hypothetical protein
MKSKLVVSFMFFVFSGLGILSFSSSKPQPNQSTARVYWYDGLTCSADFTVSGYVWGGGSASQSFTANHPGGSGIQHIDVVLDYPFTSGNIDVYYEYYQNDTLKVVDERWPFSKSSSEVFDILIPMSVNKINEDIPIEDR